MLILSRRAGEKIVFPALDMTIDVLRMKGNTVRLGIQAPPEISVLREELAPQRAAEARLPAERPKPAAIDPSAKNDQTAKKLSHALRNRLNTANLALHLFRRQAETGLLRDAEQTFRKIVAELAAIEQSVAQEQQRASEKPHSDRPLRALLVEDDANESELLAGYLRLSGFEVNTADDGANALDYLSSHEQPDIVLLDMVMPRCDGPTTVSAIRGNSRLEGMKIFAVSGSEPAGLGVTTGPAGIDRWFAKPVNPETLVHEIRLDLSRKQPPTAAK